MFDGCAMRLGRLKGVGPRDGSGSLLPAPLVLVSVLADLGAL